MISARSGAVLVRRLQQVPLDSERTEHRGDRPKAETVRTARGVRDRRTDVGPHQFGREQQREATLDLLAVERVDRVARPRAIGSLEDPEVDTTAARCACLELDAGMRRA